MWKNTGLQILLVAFATALAGELRIAPFGWEFRFGLGSSAFLFLLLFMKDLPFIRTGIVTGLMVVIFRTLTSGSFIADPASFLNVLITHLPAMFYYWTFALCMSGIPKDLLKSNLFFLGALTVLIDVFSNIIEIIARKSLIETTPLLLTEWLTLFLVAIIRVFFIVGLYANLILKQLRAVHSEQQERLEQMLSVSSSLYAESFYFKKVLDTIEQTTIFSYQLYRDLKDKNITSYSKRALSIAEQIHEVKKDSQRIMAGLTKLYEHKDLVDLNLPDLLHFVIKSNQTYSNWMGKKVQFDIDLQTNYSTSNHLPLLTLLNNLVANAIEAIEQKGEIRIQVYEKDIHTFFIVQDTGKGMNEKDLPFIFHAGFTTKFDDLGTAATGIGLSHVKNIVEMFHGEMSVSIANQYTTFTVKLPTSHIRGEF